MKISFESQRSLIVRLNQINIVETKENLNLKRKKKDYTFVNRKIRFNLLYYY